MPFTKATREKAKLRMALYGPAGGGKTLTALMLALALAGDDPDLMAVIDTERESASKYAHLVGAFNVENLAVHSSKAHTDAIAEAESMGMKSLAIDSLSHSWEGNGGILERKDALDSAGQGWMKVRPEEKALWNGVLAAKLHVIATMRSRNTWEITEENGKQKRKVVGLEPTQRKGTEYEFDVVCFMEPYDRAPEGDPPVMPPATVRLTVEKSRYEEIPRGYQICFSKDHPEGFEDFKRRVIEAMTAGEPPEAARDEEIAQLKELLLSADGMEAKRVDDVLQAEAVKFEGVIPRRFVLRSIEKVERRVAEAAAQAGESEQAGEAEADFAHAPDATLP